MNKIFKKSFSVFTNKLKMQIVSRFMYNNYKTFCNIYRLNVDKLILDKLPSPLNTNEIIPPKIEFKIEEHILEYGPDVNWETTVMNSQIPVVVDVYAEY